MASPKTMSLFQGPCFWVFSPGQDFQQGCLSCLPESKDFLFKAFYRLGDWLLRKSVNKLESKTDGRPQSGNFEIMLPNLCYISSDPSYYSGALYQNDFLEALRKVANVKLVTSYSELAEARNHEKFDAIIFGHRWLDESGTPAFELELDKLPTHEKRFFFLNKEYANLEAKISAISKLQPDLLLSHHHDVQSLTLYPIEAKILWVPFAADPTLFLPSGYGKRFDLNFSGVLRNPTYPETQKDDREKIHRLLFKGPRELIISKRAEFRRYKLFWHPATGKKFTDNWNRLNRMTWKQPKDAYARRMSMSKATLNTLSPVGLVGTRFFESALTKSLIITPEGTELQGLLEDSHVYRFEVSRRGLLEALEFATSDSKDLFDMLERTYEHVSRNHTWEQRVEAVLGRIS